jgi:hypothetical protein
MTRAALLARQAPSPSSVCALKLLVYAPLSYCHDLQHALLGLEASDMRMEERRREKVPNTFMLIHRVKEIRPPPKMPHNLQVSSLELNNLIH